MYMGGTKQGDREQGQPTVSWHFPFRDLWGGFFNRDIAVDRWLASGCDISFRASLWEEGKRCFLESKVQRPWSKVEQGTVAGGQTDERPSDGREAEMGASLFEFLMGRPDAT